MKRVSGHKKFTLVFMVLPVAIASIATVVAIQGGQTGAAPASDCTLPWPYTAFSYLPSILAFPLALIGLAVCTYRKRYRLIPTQTLIALVSLALGLMVNFLLTFCV